MPGGRHMYIVAPDGQTHAVTISFPLGQTVSPIRRTTTGENSPTPNRPLIHTEPSRQPTKCRPRRPHSGCFGGPWGRRWVLGAGPAGSVLFSVGPAGSPVRRAAAGVNSLIPN